MKAKDIMTQVSNICKCFKTETIKEAAFKMDEMNSTSVSILNSNENFIGIITQTNICSFIYENLDMNTKVEDVMNSLVAYVGKDASRIFVIEIMLTKKVHHVIVRSKDFRMVGLITSLDIVKSYSNPLYKCLFLQNLDLIPHEKINEFLSKSIEIFEKEKENGQKLFQII